jgi:hypothetical protein
MPLPLSLGKIVRELIAHYENETTLLGGIFISSITRGSADG